MKLELARVERLNLGLSAGAVLASFAFVSPHFAGSLAAGAFLEVINLGAMHRGAKSLLQTDESGRAEGANDLAVSIGQNTKIWIGVFSMRFLALAAAIFLTIEAGANPAALVIGLSIVMPATVFDAWMNRPEVVDPSTLPSFIDGRYAHETDDEVEYWENYSVWRPGKLITTERDDLISEAAAKRAATEQEIEREQWASAVSQPPADSSKRVATKQ